MNRSRFSPWNLFGYLLIAAIITGCGVGPKLLPTETPEPPPPPAPTCVPTNFYSTSEGILGIQSERVNQIAGDIYIQSLNARAANDEVRLSRERSRALQLLAYETLRWSHIDDLTVGDGKLRMVVTFISPEFIRAVILNHVIYGNIPVQGNNLSQYTNQVLASIDQRNEHLFLVTVQFESPSQSAIQINLPVKNVVIKKTDESQFEATSPNSIFNQPVNMATGGYASIVYFPIETYGKKGGCRQVLDILHDKSIPIFIQGVKISEQEISTLDFQIPFVPPLGVGSAIPTPNPDQSIPPDQYGPSAVVPPIQDAGPTGTVAALAPENLNYWQDLGRFVWANLTLDYFPTP
jgi:hypothetical protein